MISILLVAGFIFFAIRTVMLLGNRQSWRLEYQAVGQRYHNKHTVNAGVSTFTPFSRPMLNFNYRDTHATLASRHSVGFPDHKRETRMSIMVPFNIVDMELTTGELNDWRWAKNSMRKIVFDQPEFQATFKSVSRQPIEAKRQINKAIRWQLEQLRQSSPSGQLRIQLVSRKLNIAVPGDLRNCQPIDDFVRMCLKLYDLFAMLDSVGLNFINEDEVTLLESVKCPICSEEIATKTVCCIRCKTPHCEDCWSYNGECATYACDETRFTEVGYF